MPEPVIESVWPPTSPLLWWCCSDRTRVVSAFHVWTAAFAVSGHCSAFGGRGRGIEHLAVNAEAPAGPAGDDWMQLDGDKRAAGKNKSWLSRPPTGEQAALLHELGVWRFSLNRYETAYCLTPEFNGRRMATFLNPVPEVA